MALDKVAKEPASGGVAGTDDGASPAAVAQPVRKRPGQPASPSTPQPAKEYARAPDPPSARRSPPDQGAAAKTASLERISGWFHIDRTSGICLFLLGLFGLYLVFAPSERHRSPDDPLAHVLGMLAGAWAIGGALIATVLLRQPRVRFGVAAGIGVTAALLYNSVPVRPVTGALVTDLGLAGIVGAGIAGLATLFFRGWTWLIDAPAIYRWLQGVLVPRNWPGGPQPEQLGSKQLVTRWFVAIAAATGSVVGALAAQPRFWNAALEALAPKRILFTLLLMIVSITLIGPLEEYIFGRRLARPGETDHAVEHGGARTLIEDVWENFSPRAAGRLALVFLFSLQPTLLDACVGEAITRGDAQVTFVLLTSIIGPAAATYYWGAALQGRIGSVAQQAGKSTTFFSAFLYFPFTAALCFAMLVRLTFANGVSSNSGGIVVGTPVALIVAGLLAVAIAFLIDGVSAYAGGWALDFGRRRADLSTLQVLGSVGGMLTASKLAVLLLFTFLFAVLGRGRAFSAADFIVPILSMAGWTAGLLVSGFPQILHGARAAAATTNDRVSV